MLARIDSIDLPLTMPINRLRGTLPSPRLLWFIVFITLSTMIGTHVFLVNDERERLLLKSAESQHNLVESIADRLQASLEKAELLSLRLADDMYSTPDRVRQAAYKQTLYATLASYSDFDAALLIRPDGSMVAGSMASTSTANYSGQEYFEYHRSNPGISLRIGRPGFNKMSGRRVIPLTRRVNDRYGGFAGVVVVYLSVDAFYRDFQQYLRAEDRFIALANIDGTILIRYPKLELAAGTNIRNSPQYVDHYLKFESGEFTDLSPVDQVVRRYYFRNLKNYPILVVEGVNQQQLLDDIWPAIEVKTALLGTVTLLVVLLTLYLFRQLQATTKAEAKGQLAIAKMQAFQSALNDHVIVAVLDRDGLVVDVNDRFCSLSAFTRDELIGKPLPPIDGRIQDPDFVDTLRPILASGKTWHGMRYAHNKRGETYWLQTCIRPVVAAPGERQLYLLAQTDITAVKVAQQQTTEINQALLQTLALNLAIINSTRCGIFATNEKGVVVLFNSAAERLLKYSRQEVVHRFTPFRFYHPGDFQSVIENHESSLLFGSSDYADFASTLMSSEQKKWHWLRSDGSALPVLVTITPVIDPEKTIRGHVTVFDDLTEVENFEVMKSDFVSVVSHELRTPLTSIKGALSLLKSALAPTLDAANRRLLDIGLDNCKKLVGLVSDILDIDKLGRGQMKLERIRQSLAPVIAQAIAMNAPYAGQLGITLEFTPPAEPIMADIDADRMVQVLTNLLSNAAKFSSAGQSVKIFLSQQDDYITITVQDRGAGIPESFKDKVFDRFTQSDSINTKSKPGSGLGLTIVKSLVERHGGTISFDSSEGVGTSFYIRLPALAAALDAPVPVAAPG